MKQMTKQEFTREEDALYLTKVKPYMDEFQWYEDDKNKKNLLVGNIKDIIIEMQQKDCPEKLILRYLKENGIPYKQDNPYQELFYETRHLPMFKEYNSLINLYGEQYKCLKKARWYQLIGGILQSKIRLGKSFTDTRIQLLIPLPTEQGKNELMYANKKLIKAGIKKDNKKLFRLSEPISYSAESLVGKYVDRVIPNPDYVDGIVKKPKTIRERIENRGHFDNDFLELDECTQLMMSNDEQIKQAREYFSKSENPIDKNEVVKRLVDDLPHETISYYPENTDTFYFQPAIRIPENMMTQGFLRRKLIPIGNVGKFLNEASVVMFDDRLDDDDTDEEQIIIRLIKYLECVRNNTKPLNKNIDFAFTEEAKELIKKYTLTILKQGKQHSEKISNYCKLIKYTTNDNLITMSCILASAYGTTKVTPNFVSLAFMDLTEIMQNTFDFIKDNVKGDFDYGVTWKGAGYYDKECLKYLYENNCLSFDGSIVSISDFIFKIREVYPNKIGTEMARKHYKRMKEEKWIDGKQKGQTDSRVWLKFNPKIQEELDEGIKGGKGWKVYKNVYLSINDILGGLPSLPSLPT